MTIGILNWKICKKCREPFDIGLNYDLCPACRDNNKTKLRGSLDNKNE